MKDLPPLRPEGIHYAQIGFGLCDIPNKCHLQVGLVICGEDLVEVAVYGHYVALQNTSAMHKIDTDLPSWSKGAEWAHFVSHLVNIKV